MGSSGTVLCATANRNVLATAWTVRHAQFDDQTPSRASPGRM
ncbi:hypothetical protein ACFWCB_05785 [Streptomyces sp. NPDC060048]